MVVSSTVGHMDPTPPASRFPSPAVRESWFSHISAVPARRALLPAPRGDQVYGVPTARVITPRARVESQRGELRPGIGERARVEPKGLCPCDARCGNAFFHRTTKTIWEAVGSWFPALRVQFFARALRARALRALASHGSGLKNAFPQEPLVVGSRTRRV